jgi:hypothetical protein
MKKFFGAVFFCAFFAVEEVRAQNFPDNLLQKPNKPVLAVGGFINFNAAMRDQENFYSNSRLPDARMIGGFIDADNSGTKNRLSRSESLANSTEIYVKVGTISSSGIKYGAITEFEFDASTDGLNEGFQVDKGFLFTESKIGKIEFGNNNAVNQKMKVGPSSFARATGGVGGSYLQHINLPMLAHSTQLDNAGNIVCNGGVSVNADGTSNALNSACKNVKLPKFILTAQSPIAHGGYAKGYYNRANDNDYLTDSSGNITNDSYSSSKNTVSNPLYGYKDGSFRQMEDATKISYYTPRINGWQFGASFAPSAGNEGVTSSISGDNSSDIENITSWGLNYSNEYGNVGAAFSLTGEHGKFTKNQGGIERNDLNSYDAGFILTYFGFTLGGSYGFWGDSLQPKSGIYSCDYDSNLTLANQNCANSSNKFDDANYYTAGIAYEFGPFATSITHISSNFQENKYNATSLGIDYKISRGIMPYAEITQFEFESNQPKALGITAQSGLNDNVRQLKDNKGYVALIGILLSF